MILSLEHIHKDLIDIDCDVEYSEYKGTTEGFCSDDPSEIDIKSVTFLHDVRLENGTLMFQKGSYAFLDHQLEKQILAKI